MPSGAGGSPAHGKMKRTVCGGDLSSDYYLQTFSTEGHQGLNEGWRLTRSTPTRFCSFLGRVTMRLDLTGIWGDG